MTDIGRQLLAGCQLVAPLNRSFHDETFVEFHQVGQERPFQQVVAGGNLQGIETMVIQHVVNERRVHGYVAVVADEEVRLFGIEQFQAALGKTGRGGLDQFVEVLLDDDLDVMDIVDMCELVLQRLLHQPGHWTWQPLVPLGMPELGQCP